MLHDNLHLQIKHNRLQKDVRNACTKLFADTVMCIMIGTVHFKVTVE